jgi:hypothetical protein
LDIIIPHKIQKISSLSYHNKRDEVKFFSFTPYRVRESEKRIYRGRESKVSVVKGGK